MKKYLVLLMSLLFMCLSCTSQAFTNLDDLKIKWRFKTEGALRADAVVDGKVIFIASANGRLYALNKRNGKTLWKFKTGGAIVGEPLVSNGLVVFVSRDNNIYAVNRHSGKLTWKFQMKPDRKLPKPEWNYFSAAPVISYGKIYIGSGDGNLYVLDQQTGQLVWKFHTQGQIRATSLVYQGSVYQPSNDGIVYVIDANTGRLQWTFKTDGYAYNSDDFGYDRKSIYPSPIIVGNTLIIGARDGNVYAVDLQTKKTKWKFSYGTAWAMSTAADENSIYVGWSSSNQFCAIDLLTGQEKWQFSTGSHNYTTPLILDNTILFGSADGKLYQLDKTLGNKIAEYNIGREIYSSPVYDRDTDTLFFGSDDGNLYALDKAETVHKAVYQPTNITGINQYLVVDPKVTPYLSERGYEHLDSEEKLDQFILARVADTEPSVIVFVMPAIPQKVIGDNPAKGLMRQYLNAGGKVIWFSDPPNYYSLNNDGSDFIRNSEQGTALLKVNFINLNDSGNYFNKTTQEGKNWGLPKWLMATGTLIDSKDVVPLAVDEFGRTSLWVKHFSNKPGSGYVSIRTWGWNVPIKDEDLKLIDQLARYGLE